MRAALWKAHRWMGLITCVAILLWGLSGLTHPIMTRLQPTPASFMPPKGPSINAHQTEPAAWLAQHGITRVHRLSTVTWRGQAYWLAHADESSEGWLIDSQSGKLEPQGEEKLARALASHYSGRAENTIKSAKLVTAFGDDYLPVNRLLPVWAVRFDGDDDLTAYIDTRQMRLATLIDDRRAVLSQWFRWAHNWSFLDHWPRLQLVVMSVALTIVMASSLTGLYFWWRLRANASQRLAARPFKRWHRRLGLVVALTSMCFGISAMFHLWMTPNTQDAKVRSIQQTVSTDTIQTAWRALHQLDQPIQKLNWVATPVASGWSVQPSGAADAKAQVAAMSEAHHHASATPRRPMTRLFVDAASGKVDKDEGPLAQRLALHFIGQMQSQPAQTLGQPKLITQFEGEYGFLNKRLPVWRVSFEQPEVTRLYVETHTSTLATSVNQLEAAEGWSFSVLHKWHIGPINKDLRDAMSATFALLHILVALAGLCMFMRWRA